MHICISVHQQCELSHVQLASSSRHHLPPPLHSPQVHSHLRYFSSSTNSDVDQNNGYAAVCADVDGDDGDDGGDDCVERECNVYDGVC